MDELVASRTALTTSLMRARHTRLDPHPLIDDPWGDRLVPDTVRVTLRKRALAGMDADARAKALASPESIVDGYLQSSPAYGNVILRSRYTEDALERAVSCGIRQYVLIGAGFDSFSLRRPPFSRDVVVYEVDHPATQGLKLSRMKECGVVPPTSTHFVAADLATEGLGTALSRSPFRSDQPAFFSWLGVTVYLTRDANLSCLRAIAQCSAATSELVFTYLDENLLKPTFRSEEFQSLRATVASLGEPFLSGFDPATLEEELRRVGFELAEDLSEQQVLARYDSAGANGFRCALMSHVAWARVRGVRPARST